MGDHSSNTSNHTKTKKKERRSMEWSNLSNAMMGDMEDLGRLDLPAGTRAEYGPSGESTQLEPAIVAMCHELADHEGFDTKKEFAKVLSKIKFRHKYVCKNSEIYRVYKLLEARGQIKYHSQIGFFLRTKVGKSSSGILSVTVFTSPYPQYIDPQTGKLKTQRFSCKWNCYYCPNHPDHPRSYLPDEPGCLRAERLHFIAADQLTERVETLRRIGHPVDKLEVLVLGGTWESYPEAYREEFIRDLFWAANTFFDPVDKKRGVRSLEEEQRINETTQVKIIGLTLETRPDTISRETIRLLRKYGCTRVQLGVQHLDNDILKLVNRGHGREETVTALRLLKDACFKVDIHIMPDLPGTTPDRDREMFGEFLNVRQIRTTTNGATTSMSQYGGGILDATTGEDDGKDNTLLLERNIAPPAYMDGCKYYEYELEGPDVQADQWKIYPCEVTPWTVIEKWFNEGTYVPYGGGDSPELRSIIIDAKKKVFPWIRLNRVIRDIPNQHILGGNDNVNLRQLLQTQMKKDGDICHCIRCREVGLNSWSNQGTEHAELVIRKYNASDGIEYFLSYESPNESLLYGFVRLRISERAGIDEFRSLQHSALIRELHVYGQLIPTYHAKDASGRKGKHGGKVQHAGFGSKLMRRAELIAMSHGMFKMAVIAGVGTRDYYRKLGYRYDEDGGFLVKELDSLTTDWTTTLLAALGVLLCAVIVWRQLVEVGAF
jgi:histone acetyltransferase (RNA polymerase elongator complex component)